MGQHIVHQLSFRWRVVIVKRWSIQGNLFGLPRQLIKKGHGLGSPMNGPSSVALHDAGTKKRELTRNFLSQWLRSLGYLGVFRDETKASQYPEFQAWKDPFFEGEDSSFSEVRHVWTTFLCVISFRNCYRTSDPLPGKPWNRSGGWLTTRWCGCHLAWGSAR